MANRRTVSTFSKRKCWTCLNWKSYICYKYYNTFALFFFLFSNGSIKAKSSESNWRFIKEILDQMFTLCILVLNFTRQIRVNSSKRLPGIPFIQSHIVRFYFNIYIILFKMSFTLKYILSVTHNLYHFCTTRG